MDWNEAHEPAGVWNRGNVLVATFGLWKGLAGLRRDGFAYLSPRHEGEALLTTAALHFSRAAPGLKVNAEGLNSDARLRVEILDEHGRPVARYSSRDAAIVSRAGLEEPYAG